MNLPMKQHTHKQSTHTHTKRTDLRLPKGTRGRMDC